jgi:hypothetical protein
MTARTTLLLIAGLAFAAGAAPAAGRLSTMAEVGDALRACWPTAPEPHRPFVTLSFSFRRDGGLNGQPMVQANTLGGDPAARQRLAEMATAALERCTPLPLTPALAGTIAGQVFTMRLYAP